MIPAEDGLERFQAATKRRNWLVNKPDSRCEAMCLTAVALDYQHWLSIRLGVENRQRNRKIEE